MRIFKLGLGAALLMVIVAAGFAHADVDLTGTTAASFLTNGAGPRVLSMGGATLGLGGDLQSAAWNPAALASMTRGEFTLAHAGLPGDMQQEWFGAGGRFGHSATRWSLQGLYQGNGSFDGRDASNNPTGSFSAASFALGAQLAQNFGERGAVGFGAKFVNEKLGDVSGMGMTFDIGGQMRAGAFGVGASATNVGGQMRYSNAVYGFPASYGAGVSYSLPNSGLNLALDANFPKSYYGDVRFGAEWRFKDMLALRTGYRHEMSSGGVDDALSGPTFGLGAGYNGLWFDYGYLVSSVSGGSEQRLSISFHPGGLGLGGATMGDNGTGVSHAPAATAAPKSSTATAEATPAPKPGAKKTPKPAASDGAAMAAVVAPGAPNAHGASMSATTPDDAKAAPKPAEKSAPASAPAVVEKTVQQPAPVAASVAPKPAPGRTLAESAAPAARPAWVTVKSGDTIAAIARRFDTSIPAIMMENNLVTERIRVGQKLKVPDHQ